MIVAVETFVKTIKAALIWRRTWETRRKAETAIFQYLNGFYNPRRRSGTNTLQVHKALPCTRSAIKTRQARSGWLIHARARNSSRLLHSASVHPDSLTGYGGCGVAGKEQRDCGYLFGLDPAA